MSLLAGLLFGFLLSAPPTGPVPRHLVRRASVGALRVGLPASVVPVGVAVKLRRTRVREDDQEPRSSGGDLVTGFLLDAINPTSSLPCAVGVAVWLGIHGGTELGEGG